MTVAAFLGQPATGFAFLQPNDAAQSEQTVPTASGIAGGALVMRKTAGS